MNSFMKLRDSGEWGVRVIAGAPARQPGDTCEVRRVRHDG